MFGLFQLAEHVKAVLWLWENDAANWVVGSHAVVHQQTGVGIWTGNEQYGMKIVFNIPDRDRPSAHSCNGREIRLNKWERRVLYQVVSCGASAMVSREIQRQISDWASAKIVNHIGERAWTR